MAQKIGLFIGRFQPFHLGHIDALKQARKYGITEFIIGV
jgi:cytidyltransferase-like protein